MPLSKTIVVPAGYNATYWKVSGVYVNPVSGQVTFTFSGYKDQAAQSGGSVAAVSIDITFAMDQTVLATVISGGEAHAKAAGLLIGATDA